MGLDQERIKREGEKTPVKLAKLKLNSIHLREHCPTVM